MIRRDFLSIDGRRVHLRRGGSGPPVLLVHQSPQDSRAMLPIAERLVGRCTVIAPDTPHFGLSDSLEDATIPGFADVLAGICEQLSLPPALVVGVHTGALTAVEFAVRHPDRVDRVIADGYGLFTDEERESILDGYLPPNPPRDDGGHLRWLWQRLRDHYVFFPWHVKRAANRLAYNLPEPAAIHRAAMEILPRGDDYIGGYRAPFVYRRGEQLGKLQRPVLFLYREDDVLAPHADRLPPLPEECRVEMIGPGRAGADDRIIAAASAWATEQRAAPGVPLPSQGERLVGRAGSQLRMITTGAGPDLLLLHDLGRSADSVEGVAARLADTFTVHRLDLPGHGHSDPIDGHWSPA
ncbi:MAG: alpha/beta fold hydrolase, partial [Pseudomonadota bacterium]